MTQEEKQLLLKDLCARLPYGTKCRASYNKFTTTLVDVKVDPNIGDDLCVITVKLEKTGQNSPSLIEDIRPYLRPLSSMTEEEREEFNKVGGVMSYNPQNDTWAISAFTPEAYDWLNNNAFDYRGLIPMGLALEAKEGMYE